MKTEVATVGFTINGLRVEGGDGETVLQVARRYGIYIPTLCQLDSLRSEGRCRLCLVEIKGFRGYPTACTTAITEGLEVQTDTPAIEKIRKVTLELLIADHPADCLSCGGNMFCELQKLASYMGIDKVRLRKMGKNLPLDDSNPFFTHDPNKCILCGRCVQVCQEHQGVGAIDYVGRGDLTMIDTFKQAPIAESICESCGECVVVCPTGALAKKERRRAEKETKSTCCYCGVGCSLLLGTKGSLIVNVEGDPNSVVNRGKLCVKGRFGQTFVNSADRLTKPLIKRDGKFVEASWDEALELVASKFAQYKGDQFAAISSSRCTNEENYIVQKFARAVMQTNNVDNCARLCHAPTVTGLSKAFGTGGGTNPLADVEGAACLFIIGSNTTSAHPVIGARVRSVADRIPIIVADPREVLLCKEADIWLPLRSGTDVSLLMAMAKVIIDEDLHDQEFIARRTDHFDEFVEAAKNFDLDTAEKITGVPKEKIAAAARLYATHSPALIMYSLGITEHSHGTDNVLALANLALLTGNVGKPSAGVMPLRGQNNVQGSCDMGAIPGAFPGYQPVTNAEARAKFEKSWGCALPDKPGLYEVEAFQQALAGNVKALYCVGVDPAYTIADANRVQDALRAAEFVVFQDIFLTGSAEFADVILPGASFAEKDGTFTNFERRVQRVRKAIEPIGESRPDWLITCQLAQRMGAEGFAYTHPSEIMDEIARLTPSFAGMSFAKLERGGIQWPCTGPEHPGTPRLHVEKFNTPSGKGNFTALTYRPPAEKADKKYPFILTTGRNLYHYHLAMTSKVPGLVALYPEEEIWINPSDAEKLGITPGDKVKVTSRRGELVAKARVTDEVAPGTNYMSFHYYETPTNVLTNQALDPVSKTPEYKVTAIRMEKA
jgi:formate dehydrogenase alpha subunit